MLDTITTHFVGLDVHQATIAIAVADPGRGDPRVMPTIPNDFKTLMEGVRSGCWFTPCKGGIALCLGETKAAIALCLHVKALFPLLLTYELEVRREWGVGASELTPNF